MNNIHDLNCLELESLCAGMDKQGAAPASAPNALSASTGAAERPTMRQRIINMKKAIGLPESMQTMGLPKLFPE